MQVTTRFVSNERSGGPTPLWALTRSPRVGRRPRTAACLVVTLAIGLSGCGTNLEEILFQASAAAGRTVLDSLLTEFLNDLATGTGDGGQPPPQDGMNGAGNGDGSDPSGGDGMAGDVNGAGDLTGNPLTGETVYADNGCAGCHCADAAGGCALSAPDVTGTAVQAVDDSLRGDAVHPTKPDLSDGEVADLAAYLASLAGT